MKIEEFTTTPMPRGRVQIMFTEPLVEEDYCFSLFINHFKRKSRQKKINVYKQMKPKIKVFGLTCNKKMWINFLFKLKRNELAKGWYETMRDTSFKSVEEVVKILKIFQEIGNMRGKHGKNEAN